jgi:hypothetical protein
MDATDFRTRWEAEQYAADHGACAAIATGYQIMGAHLGAHGAEDAAILGVSRLPEPRPYMIPVTNGADEELRARVDAFAARHGITARWDAESSSYRAALKFGPVALIAYMIPAKDMLERVAAIKAAARGTHTAITGRSAA